MTLAVWPERSLGAEFVVPRALCSGDGWLFGGWALGLLTEAARDRDGAVVTDLQASFLRPVKRGDRLRLRREVLAAGRSLRQCRVDAFVDDRHVLAGTAIVGTASGPVEAPAAPVGVPPPGESPERRYLSGSGSGLREHLDVRIAGEFVDAGVRSRVRLWVRSLVRLPADVRLAVAGDHVPYLVRRVDRHLVRASTVSASTRVLDAHDVDEWILLDIALVARSEDVVVGRADLWSGGTRLVAVAEQTTRVKRPAG